MHKAVFFDKDGTLLEDVPYNIDPGKIVFSDGWKNGLSLLQSRGYKLFIISNQSGVAKGYLTAEDVERVGRVLSDRMAEAGLHLNGFYYCPHHPRGVIEQYRTLCFCRKPYHGLIKKASRDHSIDIKSSWVVGDILDDIEAGRRAGCRTILIDNGNETEWVLSRNRLPHHIAVNLEDAAAIICR